VRPRSASEWRGFWRGGGERELELLLADASSPLAGVPDTVRSAQAERIALLLGSAAPVRALAAELGRVRGELGVEPDPVEDASVAAKVFGWFLAQSVA
jgi:hypothetical protein